MKTSKTYSIKPSEIKREWYVLDASEVPLGRLATTSASLLLGKGKPSVTPHMDGGDYVVIINCAALVATGNKAKGKIYYRHSGFPGGIYSRTLAEQIEKDPGKVVIKAVRDMLPDNKLRAGRLARLKVYAGSEHNHTAQQPKAISLKKGSK